MRTSTILIIIVWVVALLCSMIQIIFKMDVWVPALLIMINGSLIAILMHLEDNSKNQ